MAVTPDYPPGDRLIAATPTRKRLGCSPRTLAELVDNGTLKPVFLPGSGNYRRFRVSDIEALIQGRTPPKALGGTTNDLTQQDVPDSSIQE